MKGLCRKRRKSLISYDLILLSKGEVSELSRRNTLDGKYLLRTARSDSMTRPPSIFNQSTSSSKGKRRSSSSGEGSQDDDSIGRSEEQKTADPFMRKAARNGRSQIK